MIQKLCAALASNAVFKLVLLAIVMDTIFGLLRAVKERVFNSCFGINGAIRKIAMLLSMLLLILVDTIVEVNLIGFIPDAIKPYLPVPVVGMTEFFGILYISYEAVSILKNGTKIGLPFKALWKAVSSFLEKYTNELPDVVCAESVELIKTSADIDTEDKVDEKRY